MPGLTILIWLPPAIVVAYFIRTFNRRVSHQNACACARASIDVNLAGRHDLVPNLAPIVAEGNRNTRLHSMVAMKFFIKVLLGGLILHFVGGCLPQASAAELLSNGYSVDRGSVYYRGDELDIDASGFEVLGDHWLKNNTQVYFMFTPRSGQEIRSGLWSEGEDGDFYKLNSMLGLFSKGVDAKSFTLVTDYLAADKSQVYYFNTHAPVKAPSVLKNADPETLFIIDKDYARDKDRVFYTRRHFGPCTIEKADPGTFTALSERYSKDRHNAFYECSLIENADAETFKVASGFLAKDSTNVFRSGKLVPNANPGTFEHLKHRFSNLNFYTDNQHVYYFRNIVQGADPGTFEVIGSYFFKDHQYGYFCSKKCHRIEDIDIETFREVPINSNWANDRVFAYDKDKVLFCTELKAKIPCAPLPGSDPDSFEYIGKYFSKDANNVFFKDELVKGADAATFEIFESDDHKGLYRARDANRTYKIQRTGAPEFYKYEIVGDRMENPRVGGSILPQATTPFRLATSRWHSLAPHGQIAHGADSFGF